jgi:hypothetical protein
VARRDEINRRRLLARGLREWFKDNGHRRFRRGSGYWLAPHLWFVPGITRDEDEDALDLRDTPLLSGIVGRPYHEWLPRSARHHFYQVMTALDLDLVFVEDGIGFAKLRAVLRVLFEHYDVHGGRRRIEERYLRGLPGTRVVIHDYELGHPFRRANYPQPDYEEVGRARILHVFKDRGDDTAEADVPTDSRGLPTPIVA